MAVLRICKAPEPILRRKTKKVTSIDNSIHRLIEDMIDTLHSASGVGLAAPQVGVSLRIAVISEPEKEILVLINPEVIKREGERIVQEGCLSIPGYQGEIKRSLWVKIKAKDRQGREIRIKGEGLLGQALEHEIDHLNGVLYIDRMEDDQKLYKVEPTEIKNIEERTE